MFVGKASGENDEFLAEIGMFVVIFIAVREAAEAWRRWMLTKSRQKEHIPHRTSNKPPPYKHVKVLSLW